MSKVFEKVSPFDALLNEIRNPGRYERIHCEHLIGRLDDIQKNELLYEASDYGHTQIIELLIDKKADINTKGDCGYTPLHEACLGDHINIVELLLDQQANPNIVSSFDNTPIYHCCDHGTVEIIKLLINKKANLNVNSTHSKETPLHAACAANQIESAELLIKNDADINKKDYNNKTPLDYIKDSKLRIELQQLAQEYQEKITTNQNNFFQAKQSSNSKNEKENFFCNLL